MKISDHVHALKLPFQSTGDENRPVERFVHLYFICGRRICMVDSGVAPALNDILAYLSQIGRSVAEIDLLVQTHSHPDHIGCSRALKDASGCRLAAHRDAKPWIEDIDLQYQKRPTGTFYALVSRSAAVDTVLSDGDILPLGEGRSLTVLHTPGHSRDSISFFYRPDGVLFTGDTIPEAGGRPVYEDVSAVIRSLRKLEGLKGVKVLCSAWHLPLTGDRAPALLAEALGYIQHIHQVVTRTRSDFPSLDTPALCRRVLAHLDQPPLPNVIKSIESHLNFSRLDDLLKR